MHEWKTEGVYHKLELGTLTLVVHPYERNNPDKKGQWVSRVVADRTERGDTDGLHDTMEAAKSSALERAKSALRTDLAALELMSPQQAA